VGVAGGGEDAVVTEELLDLDQIDASLDEMGGVAVTKAVGRDLFLGLQEIVWVKSVGFKAPGACM
jgi:hypothetical protein